MQLGPLGVNYVVLESFLYILEIDHRNQKEQEINLETYHQVTLPKKILVSNP